MLFRNSLSASASSSSSSTFTVQNNILKDGATFGNKSANLLELMRFCDGLTNVGKVQVPEISPLSHDSIQAHLNKYCSQWQSMWKNFVMVQGGSKTLEPKALEVLAEIRELIKNTFNKFPVNIDASYLSLMAGKHADLMVRSTGKEDDVTAANPGGNESVASVKPDNTSISSAIGIVVASYFSEKSLRQRLLSPPPSNDITQAPFMPVLLQRMIGESSVTNIKGQKRQNNTIVYSGVMYTGEKSVTIQMAPGHGELIVNSKAPFDTYFVSRDNVVYPAIYKKKYRLAPLEEKAERRLVFTENPRAMQNEFSIPTAKALEIAKIGRMIEKHYGMQMDVEFVYHPKEDVLYLVQARPIPQGDRGKFKPSSFPPNHAILLKNDKTIEKTKAAVIAPADNAAKVITRSTEIIICETISEALDLYLAQKDSQVKAVIVKNMAPATSHEAAQFNAKAIPVLQVDNLNQIEEWIKVDKSVLIIDPQRNQIVNWTNKIKDHAHAELELYRDKILEYGQFRSALPAEVTPSTQFAFAKIIKPLLMDVLLASDKDKKLDIKWNKNKLYSELQAQIEILEAAKASDKDDPANKALLAIQFFIFKFLKNDVNDPLFQHAVLFCADIKKCLDRYSLSSDKKQNSESIRGELLDLISKLSALITSSGKDLLISDSVYQVVQQWKEEKIAESYISKGVVLNDVQLSYF